MLSILRSNQPITNLLLPFTGLVFLILGYFIGAETKPLPYTHAWIPATLNLAEMRWLHYLLIVWTGWLVNRVFVRHELSMDPSILAGWVTIFSLCLAEVFLPVSPIIMGSPFFVLGLNEVLKVYRQNDAADKYFNAGFLFGIAVLFSWHYGWMLGAVIVSVLYTRAAQWREITLPIIGFFLPPLMWVSILWIMEVPFQEQWIGEQHLSRSGLKGSEISFLSYTAVLAVLGTLEMFRSFGSSSNKSKNSKAVLFFYVLFLLSGAVYSSIPSGTYSTHIAFMGTGFMVPYFFLQRKAGWQDILLYVWIGLGVWMWIDLHL